MRLEGLECCQSGHAAWKGSVCWHVRAEACGGGVGGDGEGFFEVFWSKESCGMAEKAFGCGAIQSLDLRGAMSCMHQASDLAALQILIPKRGSLGS